MEFLKKIFFTTPRNEDWSYWVYVKCNRCGEKIRARVNTRNDLSIEYGEKESDNTYFCRKVLIGEGHCYQPIEVELTFDSGRKLREQKIHGGQFISEDEFQST